MPESFTGKRSMVPRYHPSPPVASGLFRIVCGIRAWIVAALSCIAAVPAAGEVGFRLALAEIEGAGWRAGDLVIRLHRDDAGRLTAAFTAGWIELPAPLGTLRDIRGECAELVITLTRYQCGSLSVMPGDLAPALRGRLDYGRTDAAVDWQLETAPGPPGHLRFSGRLAPTRWSVDLESEDWPLADLAPVAKLLGQAWPALDGRAAFSLVAESEDGALPSLVFSLEGSDIGGGNASGTVAMAGLGVELNGSAWPAAEGLAFDARGRVTAGEIYVEPLYAALDTYPLEATVRGLAESRRVGIETFVVEQAAVLHATGEAELRRAAGASWQIPTGRVELVEAHLPAAYDIILQPYLGATPLDDLETAGLLRGSMTIEDHRPATLAVELVAVDLDDRGGRLAMYDLAGTVAWSRWTPDGLLGERLLDLDWSGGFLAGVPFGAADLHLLGSANDWTLDAPVSIPLLDGALEIDSFELTRVLAGEPEILFDARLTPIDMRALSRALDWPPLSGQLSGHLPGLSYRDGTLTLGGAFTAQLFDGTVEIRDLHAERIFQPPSRLTAEIELQNLALGELSEALSFGSMTGRVEGHVHGLEMIDWRPVAFDARVQTPPDDRSTRRISQRAVDNIASLGGGGSGLSTGLLGLFEEFSYDAFALGCRLEGGVCEMSGLEARENGYTILRGSGLPRIDIVGFARQVSWPTLMEQIAAIMASEGPEMR